MICKQFQKTGVCKFKPCKYSHSCDGSSCIGKACKLQHQAQSQVQSQAPKGQKSTASKSNPHQNIHVFIDKLKYGKTEKMIEDMNALYLQAWSPEIFKTFPVHRVATLVESMGKLSYGTKATLPTLSHVCSALVLYITHVSKLKDLEAIAKSLESVLFCVQRFIECEIEEALTHDQVTKLIENVLGEMSDVLKPKTKSHRVLIDKVNNLFEELEKPWKIKLKAAVSQGPGFVGFHIPEWKKATVEWLLDYSKFLPPLLPKFKSPYDPTNGIYNSAQEYFDVVEKVWTALTFGKGFDHLFPTCRQKQQNGSCGNVLWPIKDSSHVNVNIMSFGSAGVCSARGCENQASFGCPNRGHHFKLCDSCISIVQHGRLGSGNEASTHLYDGVVNSVAASLSKRNSGSESITDGILYLNQVVTRKQPQFPIHWQSTPRLQSPNLVALIKVNFPKAQVDKQSRITWCEVIQPSMDYRESLRLRSSGHVALRILDLGLDADTSVQDSNYLKIPFKKGDQVVLLDCMTFVPEFVPVLKAFENQKKQNLAFHNGKLLALQGPVDYIQTSTVQLDMNNLTNDIIQLIEDSNLEPLIQIRREQDLKQSLVSQLVALVKKATLDPGQTTSFIQSLLNPVHCTQGPPGTGKSYLGVVIVQALLIIRKIWIQAQPSIGTPPILVLSYKNHAVDEFLYDLSVKESSLTPMVRLGGQCKDPRLQRYSERGNINNDPNVISCERCVEELINLKGMIKEQLGKSDQLLLAQPDNTLSKELQVANKGLAVQAVDLLIQSVKRIQSFLPTLTPQTFDFPKDVEFSELVALFSQKRKPTLQDFVGLTLALHPSQKDKDLQDLLWLWLSGQTPPSLCHYNNGEGGCKNLTEQQSIFCIKHKCSECDHGKVPGFGLCKTCKCADEECEQHIFGSLQVCSDHACIICLAVALKTGEMKIHHSVYPYPRNTCEEHTGCLATTTAGEEVCFYPREPGVRYCKYHYVPPTAKKSKGNQKTRRKNREKKMQGVFEEVEVPKPQIPFQKCLIENCDSGIVLGGELCRQHVIDRFSELERALQLSPQVHEPVKEVQQEPEPPKKEQELKGTTSLEETEVHSDIEFSDDDDFQDVEQPGQTDNLDEIEEPEFLTHLKEVFEVPIAEYQEDSSDEESVNELEPLEIENQVLVWKPPNEWNFQMDIEERWYIISNLVKMNKKILLQLEHRIEVEHRQATKELHISKVKASSRLYKDKHVICGTMVGCIARLEAVRATKPFAILVEEASEVLEPLLFSCLCPSTCKLEMVGDHLQLQPSMMQKIEFERINKVNISMFERLIASKEANIPQSVLSVQRRMRSNIANLTRGFYKEITSIEDASICNTRTFDNAKLKENVDKGMLVPCVVPQVYMWTHSGKQTKATKGLSRVNNVEADMVVQLAKFIVDSGVSKDSVAILTPYKGQLMLIRDMLKKEGLISFGQDKTQTGCVLSTVDRFQGDEADIVIVSLVIDENSKTPFVKLQNRMIVLLSRARMAMYIVGNLGYFEKDPSEHWKKTLQLLELPGETDALVDDDLLFHETRVGPKILICCPVHRKESTKWVTSPNDLKRFCETKCHTLLKCGHLCTKNCHFPDANHVKECQEEIVSPCVIHRQVMKCHSLTNTTKNIDTCLKQFHCPVKVELLRPCGHEERLTCFEETSIASGERTLPDCKKQAFEPFIRPGCGHKLQCSCYELQIFKSNPEKARHCSTEVPFIAPCGHVTNLKCYMDQQVKKNIATFVCKHKVDVILPRCHHQVKVTCAEARMIANWQGTPSSTPGVVYEGQHYGPKDYNCKETVRFVRSCGHETTTECQVAFDLCLNQPKCAILVPAISPLCGHEVKVPCFIQKELEQHKWTGSPMDTFVEGHSVFKQLSTNLVSQLPPCGHKVEVTRKCGHKATQVCSKVRITLSSIPCTQKVAKKNPLCNHSMNIPCNLQNVAYEPWRYCPDIEDGQVPFVDNVISNEINSPTNCESVIKDYVNCSEMVQLQLAKTCGHLFPMPCFRAIECLKTKKFPVCKETVETSLNCGHQSFVDCNTYQSYLGGEKKSIKCEVKVKRFCRKAVPSFDIDVYRGSLYKLDGIAVNVLTKSSLNTLLNNQKKELMLVIGVGMVVTTLHQEKWQIGKSSRDWASNLQKLSLERCADSLYVKSNSSIVFWPPFTLLATHTANLDPMNSEAVLEAIEDLEILPARARGFIVPADWISRTENITEPLNTMNLSGLVPNGLFRIAGFNFNLENRWNLDLIPANMKGLPEQTKKELKNKLSFANIGRVSGKTANAFAGMALLEKLESQTKHPLVSLFKSLETSCIGLEQEEALDFLKDYRNGVVEKKLKVHPLYLVALARTASSSDDKLLCLQTFMNLYSKAQKWLKKDETDLLNDSSPVKKGKTTAIMEWEKLKESSNCRSDAMEELLKLTGLEKVKLNCISMFKTAMALKKMTPEERKKNMFSTNKCFLGNPGTGKTTVARLFGKILVDAQIRTSNVFVDTNGQALKDNGVDKFREVIKSCLGGVLFIDEIYILNPGGDPRGKDIVSELLIATENLRGDLTIIIAGYENDIQKNLYDYNQGFKSRFTEVVFDDFDVHDLELIYREMLKEKGWESDERIGPVLSKKLGLGIGKKGFGNARDVRKAIEDATVRAMSRDDFTGQKFLKIEDVIGDKPTNNEKLSMLLEELYSKIGWTKVKEAIKNLVDLANKNYARMLEGQSPLPVMMNRMFLGNPGVGKTTCAQLYGKILKQLNYLSNGEVVLKGASDFMGAHVGESQSKTNSILDQSAGKVLVIDEAYALNDKLYGKQVLDTLVERVQNESNSDIAVLLLGYEDEMLEMLRDQNPGLSRRFPKEYAFYFEDYTDAELLQILIQLCKKDNIKCSKQVYEKMIEAISKQRTDGHFGNVGSLKNLLNSVLNKALPRQKDPTVTYIAVSDVFPDEDESNKRDPYEALRKMYKVDNIIQTLVELENFFKVSKQEGDDNPEIGHFIFRGSPGTGKTTVARIIGEILFNIGVLPSKKVVETSGLDLTAEYVGHTKEKVTGKLKEAAGGVLFVDEAYELGKGTFGEEAMTTILAAVTDPKYVFVMIMAGYPVEMNDMLDRNAGLKSRFTKFIDFKDWSFEDCCNYLSVLAEKESFVLSEGYEMEMGPLFKELIGLDGWANGRDVMRVWKDSKKYRANRVVKAQETIRTITIDDMLPAIRDIIVARKVPKNAKKMTENVPVESMLMEAFQHQHQPRNEPKFQENEGPKIEEIQEEEVQMGDERDPGVDDAVWEELQKAKEAYQQELLQRKRELEELQRIKDEQERERQRLRILAEQRRKEQEEKKIQEKLKRLMKCPAGFVWTKVGGGWRCGGGSHYVSQKQLEEQFMCDA